MNRTHPTAGMGGGDFADKAVALGCAALFLYYLNIQLGHSWQAVMGAGGATLADTYKTLTGDAGDPFPAFAALLTRRFPPGGASGFQTDNPFPL